MYVSENSQEKYRITEKRGPEKKLSEVSKEANEGRKVIMTSDMDV